ncbi:Soyasaponin III rhamnosyltransferase [Camellia lanceoleosa]|uniref:Soyasaponin III rhamnosyltransferase n=1 Tax=Camellia lanceoleosa TaxID=1840588 RepID=A0ACC0I7K7_9ERIC|nr:Soyasaponin III rhamnosyltransferase [Camellia lanceoleosa]
MKQRASHRRMCQNLDLLCPSDADSSSASNGSKTKVTSGDKWGGSLGSLRMLLGVEMKDTLLVEKGLAIEVERVENGLFSGNDIALCLRKAIVSKEGDEMRAQVKKASTIFADQKLQDLNVAGFVEYLQKRSAS